MVYLGSPVIAAISSFVILYDGSLHGRNQDRETSIICFSLEGFVIDISIVVVRSIVHQCVSLSVSSTS